MRGYIYTAGEHNADIVTTLRNAMLGHPWMSPIPADLL